MKYVLVIGGDDDDEKPRSGKKVPLMPNPFPPENIFLLVAIGSTINGLALIVYKLIKVWVDDRKARKIKVKKGNVEMEIQGGMSAKEIKKALNAFRKLAKVDHLRDVKVTIPKNCDPSVSMELLRKANEE